ncbi:hypothetical protein NPIL_86301 [Nephila pilipes]|uniref:Uncharacterized protein n=1 Tax=Nephila pilipes TaxID=299642 RepID=A0A8X6UKD6_NEPPI|nr:hypothetical protein NPIL_86301 [Nephila pilipes]
MYQLLLIANQVNCGAKKDFFKCIMTHLCDCGFYDEYQICWMSAPEHVIAIGTGVVNQYLDVNTTAAEGLAPFYRAMCPDRDNEIYYKIYREAEDRMKAEEKKIMSNPLNVKETIAMQKAKSCTSPLINRCIEYGDECP